MSNQELNICYLYPRHMSLYGDRGNIFSLQYRANQRGISTNVQHCEPGEAIKPETNIIMLGGGQDVNQDTIYRDLLTRKQHITDLLNNGCIVLAICGGYQLMGEYYETDLGVLQGLELLDIYTEKQKEGEARIIGNLITESELFGKLWGFENHGGRTYLRESATPLARVLQGYGNNLTDRVEGCIKEFNNNGLIIGTYFHTFLPKNYQVTDYIIQRVLRLESLEPLDNSLEEANKAVGLGLSY